MLLHVLVIPLCCRGRVIASVSDEVVKFVVLEFSVELVALANEMQVLVEDSHDREFENVNGRGVTELVPASTLVASP